MSEQLFDVGKVVNTHGIRGELKIYSTTDFPEERFRKGNSLLLYHPSLPGPIQVTVEAARPHKNTYIIKFKEFQSINDVEKFKNGLLKIAGSERTDLEEDEFYYDEIIGCDVWTDEGNRLGKVTEILETGANDVWVIKPENGRDILLPYIDDCILQVDIKEKKVIAHIIEGLIE
jgi:16S rRNA processing protein RimM